MRVLVLLITASLLAFAMPSLAEGCVPSNAEHATATPATGLDLRATFGQGSSDASSQGIYYLVMMPCNLCTLPWDIWVYQEDNGIPGLQRGDEVIDNTCGGVIPSDHIIF